MAGSGFQFPISTSRKEHRRSVVADARGDSLIGAHRHNPTYAQCTGSGDQPLRVLHLVSTFAVKTDTKWLYQLLKRLPRDRLASSIACMYGGGEMRAAFEQAGFATFDLQAARSLDPLGLWRLLRLIRRVRPHIVHTHLLRADLYGGLAARLAGVPIVLTTQYALYPYSRVTQRACDNLLDRMCRSLASHALAVCEAVRQDLIVRLGWPAERVHTIRTGLDFSAWRPDPQARQTLREQWAVPKDGIVIMTVARLSREKGLDVLVDAAARVRTQCPQARFVLVGSGPLEQSLARQIRDRGLEETVRLAGFHTDVASVLSAADVFVLPSYSEGMPNAVLEAFAAGLPVVASAVGGLVEAVDHERTGLLVPAGDAAALAEAVSRLIQDPSLARTLAQAGVAVARERFSIDKVAAEYAALYASLGASRPGMPPASVTVDGRGVTVS